MQMVSADATFLHAVFPPSLSVSPSTYTKKKKKEKGHLFNYTIGNR